MEFFSCNPFIEKEFADYDVCITFFLASLPSE